MTKVKVVPAPPGGTGVMHWSRADALAMVLAR